MRTMLLFFVSLFLVGIAIAQTGPQTEIRGGAHIKGGFILFDSTGQAVVVAAGQGALIIKGDKGIFYSNGEHITRLDSVIAGVGGGKMQPQEIVDSLNKIGIVLTKVLSTQTDIRIVGDFAFPRLVFYEDSAPDSVALRLVSNGMLGVSRGFNLADYNNLAPAPNDMWIHADTLKWYTGSRVNKIYFGAAAAKKGNVMRYDGNTWTAAWEIVGETVLGAGDSVQITTNVTDTSYAGTANIVYGTSGKGAVQVRFYNNHVVTFATKEIQDVSGVRITFRLTKKQYPVGGIYE